MKLTVSPGAASPPTEPVTLTEPPASAALTMSSAVILSTAIVAAAVVSTACVEVAVAVNGLPASSAPDTVTSKLLSPARSAPATAIENVLSAYDGVHGGVELDVKVSSNIPVMPLDPEQFKRVLTNLIDNAVKYAPDQTLVEVHVADSASGRQAFAVRDHGPGLGDVDAAVLPHPSNDREMQSIHLASE